MTRQEALKLLNLKEGFTQDALKKAYREESKKVHPDMHPEEYEKYNEKFKEINEANEILSGKRPAETSGSSYSSDNSYSQSYFDLEQYKKNKIDEIKNMVGETDNRHLKTILFCFEMALDLSISKEAVDKTYQSTKTLIYHFFEDYKSDWYVMYELSDDMIPEEINYNAKFDDFCKQLERIRDRYSKKYHFQKRLDEATEIYKNYATYNERIASRISQLKEETLDQAKINKYSNLEELISSMHSEIEEEFNSKVEIEKRIENIAKEAREQSNYDFMAYYKILLTEYQKGVSLSRIREQIKKLEKWISLLKNATPVKVLHDNLIKRFTEAIQKNKNNNEEIVELNEKLTEILKLFDYYDEGMIGIDTLLELDDHNFERPIPISIEFVDFIKGDSVEDINEAINELNDDDREIINKNFGI